MKIEHVMVIALHFGLIGNLIMLVFSPDRNTQGFGLMLTMFGVVMMLGICLPDKKERRKGTEK